MTPAYVKPSGLILPPGAHVSSGLLLPPARTPYVPTAASVRVVGQEMPRGGHARDQVTGAWSFRLIQERMGLLARIFLPFMFVVSAPGTGKTAGILFAFWEMLAIGRSRYLFVVVPNRAILVAFQQAVKDYIGPMFKLVEGTNKNSGRCIDPEDPFCLGVIVTYQALNQPESVNKWIDSMNAAVARANRLGRPGGVFLVFDEGHHLANTRRQHTCVDDTDPNVVTEESSFRPWCAVAHKLYAEFVVRLGGFAILATGTPDRHDGHALPIVYYCADHDPDKNHACAGSARISDVTRSFIRKGRMIPHIHAACSYQEAYEEGSVKRLCVVSFPAKVKYLENGEKKYGATNKAGATDRETRNVLHAALAIGPVDPTDENDSTDSLRYLFDAMRGSIRHWKQWRLDTFHFWRFLGICPGQKTAARLAAFVLNELGVNVGLAISGDKEAMEIWKAAGGTVESGAEALEKFKAGDYDALISVAMASEGYDVQEISHVGFFSNYRTETFSIQSFTRGVRACMRAIARGMKSQDQICFICMPADSIAMEHLENFQVGLSSGSLAKLMEEPGGDESGDDGSGEDGEEESDEAYERIKPIDAKLLAAYTASAMTASLRSLMLMKKDLKLSTKVDVAPVVSDDERRMNDLKEWTRGAKGLQGDLNKRYHGWRNFKGAELMKVWSFVKRLKR